MRCCNKFVYRRRRPHPRPCPHPHPHPRRSGSQNHLKAITLSLLLLRLRLSDCRKIVVPRLGDSAVRLKKSIQMMREVCHFVASPPHRKLRLLILIKRTVAAASDLQID